MIKITVKEQVITPIEVEFKRAKARVKRMILDICNNKKKYLEILDSVSNNDLHSLDDLEYEVMSSW